MTRIPLTKTIAPATSLPRTALPDGFSQRAARNELTDEDREALVVDEALRPSKQQIALDLAVATQRTRLEEAETVCERFYTRNGLTTGDASRGRLELLADMQVDEPDPPHFTFIADKGATMLFGKGGSGKGSYAAWIALRAVRQLGWKVLLIDSELRDYEWKPRLVHLGATDEEQQSIAYYKPTSAPIWDQVADILTALAELGFTPDLRHSTRIRLESCSRSSKGWATGTSQPGAAKSSGGSASGATAATIASLPRMSRLSSRRLRNTRTSSPWRPGGSSTVPGASNKSSPSWRGCGPPNERRQSRPGNSSVSGPSYGGRGRQA